MVIMPHVCASETYVVGYHSKLLFSSGARYHYFTCKCGCWFILLCKKQS